jgi:hypothetical protein
MLLLLLPFRAVGHGGQVLGAALHRLVPGRRQNAGHGQQFGQMFGVLPLVEFLVVLGVDIDVH